MTLFGKCFFFVSAASPRVAAAELVSSDSGEALRA